MTDKRMEQLFYDMFNHITELVDGEDLFDTLSCIGFTYEEMIECDVDFEDGDFSTIEIKRCPSCNNVILVDECETDKYWDDDGNHIWICRCPHCNEWLESRDLKEI